MAAMMNWPTGMRNAPATGGATVENPGTNFDTISE
jgi:hypothetical protein